MPRKDDGMAGEGEQFFGNTREEEFAVTSRQIPTSDPAGKEHISAEEQIRSSIVNAEASRAMTGHLENVEGVPEQLLRRTLEEF